MEQKKKRKITILCVLAFALLVWGVALFTIHIGSLGVEERVIKKNGEIIYVRDDCPWDGNTLLFAGIVTQGDALFPAFYVPGDTEREWLYVTGWRFRGFYRRIDQS